MKDFFSFKYRRYGFLVNVLWEVFKVKICTSSSGRKVHRPVDPVIFTVDADGVTESGY